jgi:hypothetical protein
MIRPDVIRVRYVLVMFGLVAVFYCLASILIGRMPFTATPAWWTGIWPSRKIAVYIWFGLLNTVGAFIAAVPVGVSLRWLIEGDRVRAAFTVGAATAFLMIAAVVVHYAPLTRASTLMAAELFIVVLLAVPFWVWFIRAFPFRGRFENSSE